MAHSTDEERPVAVEPVAELRAMLRERPPMVRELPSFDPERAPAEPAPLFVDWLLEALRAGVPDAQLVTLATVAADGGPDARVVVLRDVEAEAGLWWFLGDSRSPKGRQLAAVPRAALTAYWPAFGRQVRVRGSVSTADPVRTAAAFRAASPAARIAALVGRQSELLTGAAQFEEAWDAARQTLAEDPAVVAPGHTLYAVRAEQVEFWQGAADRRHVRLCYQRDAGGEGGWRRGLLWP